MSILTKLLDPNEREVKRHHAVAEAINALEPELKALDDAGLRARSDALREQAREDHDLDELLIEAFALCREAGRRSIGLRHFDVQLVGGIVLHQGKIAEMQTGEGKTLVASLRDNMARDLSPCSQRGLNYAIVDEVDSILIDEARTPHIISGQSDESTDKYYQYARWAARLAEGEDFEVDLKHKSASLTEIGIAKMERWTGIKNIYDLENVIEAHQINQALKAKALFLRDRDYLVKDAEVIIVDA